MINHVHHIINLVGIHRQLMKLIVLVKDEEPVDQDPHHPDQMNLIDEKIQQLIHIIIIIQVENMIINSDIIMITVKNRENSEY
jgi:hypothetical protein